MWAKIEPWIILFSQWAIYSWIMTISWNELFKKVEWIHVDWTQTMHCVC